MASNITEKETSSINKKNHHWPRTTEKINRLYTIYELKTN